MLKKIIFLTSFVLLALIRPPSLQSQADFQEEILEGRVIKVIKEEQITPEGAISPQLYQQLEVYITNGSLTGQTITIENGNLPMSRVSKYKVDDALVINASVDFEGKNTFYITDVVRRGTLFWLFIWFVVTAAIIGRKQGITSLVGMVISFLIIFNFILPQIASGKDPVLIAIAGSLIIIPVTFLLSHGLNAKTGMAILGTYISLFITGILAKASVSSAKLTGYSSEEATFLQAYYPNLINIQGLLLAGIIIGTLGVLDDITISQSAIVYQLKTVNPKLKAKQLYHQAMTVGKDHIASMVNTLILVYTGAALPLLILFVNNPRPLAEIINYEIVAEEIVRTLVGSIGLMLAVPITTIMAASYVSRKKSNA